MFVGRPGPDVQARGSALFVPLWLSGRRTWSWPAGSACVLTAGGACWVTAASCCPALRHGGSVAGSVAGARFGSREAQARVRGSLRGRRGRPEGRVPTAVAAARCSAPEPSGDDRTCVPQSGSRLQMEGVQAEDRHAPLPPYCAISYSAEVSIWEGSVPGYLSATDLRELQLRADGNGSVPCRPGSIPGAAGLREVSYRAKAAVTGTRSSPDCVQHAQRITLIKRVIFLPRQRVLTPAVGRRRSGRVTGGWKPGRTHCCS